MHIFKIECRMVKSIIIELKVIIKEILLFISALQSPFLLFERGNPIKVMQFRIIDKLLINSSIFGKKSHFVDP